MSFSLDPQCTIKSNYIQLVCEKNMITGFLSTYWLGYLHTFYSLDISADKRADQGHMSITVQSQLAVVAAFTAAFTVAAFYSSLVLACFLRV